MTWPLPDLPSPSRITEVAIRFEHLLTEASRRSFAVGRMSSDRKLCAEQCFGIFHCIQAHCVVLLRDVRGA
jgi:hypothetical protein